MANKDGRIELRIDPELKVRSQAYVKRNHTSLSDVFRRFLVRLLEEDERKRRGEVDAEQI